jgi:hypothetical protein
VGRFEPWKSPLTPLFLRGVMISSLWRALFTPPKRGKGRLGGILRCYFLASMAARKEILSSLVLLAFGALFLLYDIKYPLDQWSNPGPGVFPLIVGTIWMILAVWQLIQALRRIQPLTGEKKEKKDTEPVKGTFQGTEGGRTILFMIAVFVIYLLMIKWVGFFTSNFLFVMISSRLVGAKEWKGPVALSAGITLFCYILFEVWLKLSFPRGILF